MNEALIADKDRARQILERIPAGRWGSPEDFEGAIVFLASRASDYVTGECLVIDGGWMARECVECSCMINADQGYDPHQVKHDREMCCIYYIEGFMQSRTYINHSLFIILPCRNSTIVNLTP